MVHVVDEAGAKWPAEHTRQATLLTAVLALTRYVPGAQGLQASAWLAPEYWPAAHALHVEDWAADHVPASQPNTLMLSGVYQPAEHVVHVLDAEPDHVPASQLLQFTLSTV